MFFVTLFYYLFYFVAVNGSSDYEQTTDPNEYVGPSFEGDILGFNNIEDFINGNQDPDVQNNALDEEVKKWSNGIVYYEVSNQFSCKEECIIHEAMQEMELKTCLKFFKRNDQQESYIEIKQDTKLCASYIGRQGNVQQLYLTPSCAASVGQVIHELMHAIGFFHEQSRSDRNDYVEVMFDNIAEIDHINFKNHGQGNMTTYGLPYDFDSIMHYRPYDFSKNRQMTVRSRNGQQIGQREKMSDLDIKKINTHYKCQPNEYGCHDTMGTCRTSPNWKEACRNQNFRRKCQKTCGRCENHEFSSHDANCQTAAQRCAKWSTYFHCDKASFSEVVRSSCYQSCACQL